MDQYVRAFANDEWETMKNGEASPRATAAQEYRPHPALVAGLIFMGTLAMVVTSAFLLTVILDYRFAGQVSVSNAPVQTGQPRAVLERGAHLSTESPVTTSSRRRRSRGSASTTPPRTESSSEGPHHDRALTPTEKAVEA